jgi:hypothetical protein
VSLGSISVQRKWMGEVNPQVELKVPMNAVVTLSQLSCRRDALVRASKERTRLRDYVAGPWLILFDAISKVASASGARNRERPLSTVKAPRAAGTAHTLMYRDPSRLSPENTSRAFL